MERKAMVGNIRHSPRYWYAVLAAAFFLFVYFVLRGIGMYTLVVDELTYSMGARHIPFRESPLPVYIYYSLYGLTARCGYGFLECARIFNALFLAAALPVIYVVCRRVATPPVAVFVAVAAAFAPVGYYALYFMPETMYFFCFWLLVWLLLSVADRSARTAGALSGVSLGLLAMVKPHAMFLLPGLWLFAVLMYWRTGPGLALRKSGLLFLLALATFLVVRLGVGYALAGDAAFNLFGKLYASKAVLIEKVGLPRLLGTVFDAGWSLIGHVAGLALLYAVPLADSLWRLWRGEGREGGGRGAYEVAALAIALLLVLVPVTAAFTAHIAAVTPSESIARLHLRYYSFLFPFFLIVAASQVNAGAAGRPSPLRGIFALCVGALAVYAFFVIGSEYRPGFVDSLDLIGVTKPPAVALLAVSLSVGSLAVWAWSGKWGARVFLFAIVPLFFGMTVFRSSVLLQGYMVQSDDVAAGRFARQVLGAASDKLAIAGPGSHSVFEAQFAVDNPGTLRMVARPDQPLKYCAVPSDRDWLLLLGNQQLDLNAPVRVETAGFSLVSLSDRVAVDFSHPDPLSMLAPTGLSGAESWGRWSDGTRVALRFFFRFPERIRVTMSARAYGPNVGEPFAMRIGSQVRKFSLGTALESVSLDFETDGNAQTIEILVPKPASPSQFGQSDDRRRLGIGLGSLGLEWAGVPGGSACRPPPVVR